MAMHVLIYKFFVSGNKFSHKFGLCRKMTNIKYGGEGHGGDDDGHFHKTKDYDLLS